MSFIETATAAAQRGLAVFPTLPGERGPCKGGPMGWTTGASTDPKQLIEWAAKWPGYNVIVVSNPATSISLDMDQVALAVKHGFPLADCENTLWVRTPGGGLHLHFLPGKFAGWIESNKGITLDGALAVEYKYKSAAVAAPGSVRSDGGTYVVERDNPLQPIPISVMTWLLAHVESEPTRQGRTRGIPVDKDFDFDDLTDFFDIDIMNVSGVWHTPRACPIKGDYHTTEGKPDYRACAFAWDESARTLGWKDHAASCDGAEMHVKEVIEFLEDQKGECYPDPLWNDAIEDTAAFPVQLEAEEPPRPTAALTDIFTNAAEAPQEQNPAGVAEHSAAIKSAKPPRLFSFSDSGNTERLVYWYGDGFKYSPQRGWHIWDGKRWVRDVIGKVLRAALKTVRAIPEVEGALASAGMDPKDEEYDKLRARISKFALASESRRALEAMVALSRSAEGIAADITEFDRDNWLFNCQNETLGLFKREQHPQDQRDMITSVSPVVYDPTATCPTWERFLHEIMGGNVENIGFLQRAAGYSLTGSAAEQCMFVLYGGGRNGKSTFLEVLRFILGDYGKVASMGMFLDTEYSQIPNDLAALAGARFVSATESREGRRLDEAKIKQITGGDTVPARFLRQEFFEFRPEFKIWLATNHKPTIKGTDDGIWRRIRLVPFTVQIPLEQVDKRLRGKLIAEAPGILNWMIAGLEDYRAGGLRESREVLDATKDYRDGENWVVRFLATEAEAGPYTVQARDLFNRYKTWAAESKEYMLSERKFNAAMDESSGLKVERPLNKKTFHGVRLRLRTAVSGSRTMEDADSL